MFPARASRNKVIGAKAGVGRTPEKKKKPRRKPQWDDSIQDLSVHKASVAEMARRQMVALSKNLEAVRIDRLQKRIGKARKQSRSPARHRNYLTREILYDASQLEDVLSKSDRAMAVVKDLFGDDAQKHRGVPNVTIAPIPDRAGIDAVLNNSLPDGSSLDPSKLDMLSDTMMDRHALNDMGSDSDTDSSDIDYEPQIDVERFKKLLALAEFEAGKAKKLESKNKPSKPKLKQGQMVTSSKPLGLDADAVTPDLHTPGQTPPQSPKIMAMNDTGKCQRTKARTSQGGREEEDSLHQSDLRPQSLEITNLDDLKKVLDGLENNIADYERLTGRQPAAQRLYSNSFSGYTVGLIDAVTRMTTYLKQGELRLRAETTVREHLSEDVNQMRTLVDALTSDIIATQEEYAKLQTDFVRFRKDMSQEVAILKQSLAAHGLNPPPVTVPAQYPSHPATYPSQYQPQPIAHPIPNPVPQSIHPASQGYPPQGHSVQGSQQLSVQQHQQQQYMQSRQNVGQLRGQPVQNMGQPVQSMGQRVQNIGQRMQNIGQPVQSMDQRVQIMDQPMQNVGQPLRSIGQLGMRHNQAPDVRVIDVRCASTERQQAMQMRQSESLRQEAERQFSQRRHPQSSDGRQNGVEPSVEELSEHMTAALSEAVKRQEDNSKAFLLSPPKQMDSPQAGSKSSAAVVPPSSAASRALQFDNPSSQHAATSAFAAYTKHGRASNNITAQGQSVDGDSRTGPAEQQHQAMVGRDPVTGLDDEGKSLLDQIAELNKQHEDAQRKLVELRDHQQQRSDRLPAGISPSISPISHAEDSIPADAFRKQTNISYLRHPKEIKVSLPRMDS